MDFNEFKTQLEERIIEEYPDCNLVEREDVWSIILPGEHIVPAINMNHMYNNHDDDIEGIIEAIKQAFDNKPVIDEEKLKNWDMAKEVLMYCLISKDNVTEAMITKPFTESILQVARLDLGDGTVIVNKQLAKMWKKSEDEIITAATNNVHKYPATIETMGNVAKEAAARGMNELGNESELIDALERITPPSELMYVVSNKLRTFGASAITYESVINQLEEILEGSFYIIPSSIHEVLVIKENPERKESFVQSIREVNQEILEPREVLCGNIIKYDVKTKKFSEV